MSVFCDPSKPFLWESPRADDAALESVGCTPAIPSYSDWWMKTCYLFLSSSCCWLPHKCSRAMLWADKCSLLPIVNWPFLWRSEKPKYGMWTNAVNLFRIWTWMDTRVITSLTAHFQQRCMLHEALQKPIRCNCAFKMPQFLCLSLKPFMFLNLFSKFSSRKFPVILQI